MPKHAVSAIARFGAELHVFASIALGQLPSVYSLHNVRDFRQDPFYCGTATIATSVQLVDHLLINNS